MEQKIRKHIEGLFITAPNTRQANELREEIIRNTIERYHDFLEEGKNQQEAYNLAIAGIGDINELIVELGGREIEDQTYTAEQLRTVNNRKKMFTGVAAALYILCVTPTIVLDGTALENISSVFLFFMISIATGMLVYSAKTKYIDLENNPAAAAKIRKSAVMKAVAVGLFISCVTPCIFLSEAGILANIAPVFMLMMIAAGVVILILNKGGDQNIDKKKIGREAAALPKKKISGMYRMLVAVLWVIVSVVFIILLTVSPYTIGFAWLVFPLAAALQGLMRALFEYAEVEE